VASSFPSFVKRGMFPLPIRERDRVRGNCGGAPFSKGEFCRQEPP